MSDLVRFGRFLWYCAQTLFATSKYPVILLLERDIKTNVARSAPLGFIGWILRRAVRSSL